MDLGKELENIMGGKQDREELSPTDFHRALQVREKWYLKNVYPIVQNSFSDITKPSVLEDFMEWCKKLRPTVRTLGWIDTFYPLIADNIPPINTREGFEQFHVAAKRINPTKRQIGFLENVAPLMPLQFPKFESIEDIEMFLEWVDVRRPLTHDIRVIETAAKTTTPKNYKTVWTEEDLDEMVEWLGTQEYMGIDTETTGVEKFEVDMVGFSIYGPNTAWYVPVKHVDDINESEWARKLYEYRVNKGEDMVVGVNYVECLPIEVIREKMKPILGDSKYKWIFHNYAFDYHIIRRHLGVEIELYYDTQIGQKILDESVSARLKDMAGMYLNEPADTFSELFGDSVTFDTVPVLEEPNTRRYNLTTKYAALDAELTYRMWEFQISHLRLPGMEELYNLVFELELPFQRVCVDVEQRGVAVDRDYLKNTVEPELYEEVETLREKVFTLANKEFIKYQPEEDSPCKKIKGWKSIWNLDSPQQVSQVLFDELKLPILNKDKPNSTDRQTLKKLSREGHEICGAILDFRGKNKLYNDFAIKLQEQISDDGRIHTSYRTIMSTGRMSSSSPNLQQMPSYTNVIRKAFIADPGRLLVSMDFSGQELRILAEISGDDVMYKIFTEGGDMHSTTATGIHNDTINRLRNSGKEEEIEKLALQEEVDVSEFLRLRSVYERLGDKNGNLDKELLQNKEVVDELLEAGILRDTSEEVVAKEVAAGEYCEGVRENTAKAVNFSIVYGTTPHGMSDNLGVSMEEAEAFMDSYKNTYPGVAQWMKETEKNLYKDEYVTTLLGRKRRLYQDVQAYKENDFNKWRFERAVRRALNSPIQGSAADMIKLATLNMQETIAKYDMNIVLFVHDEIIFDVPMDIGYEPLEEVASIMCNAIPLKCGMESDIEIYRRWGERLSNEEVDELFSGKEQ